MRFKRQILSEVFVQFWSIAAFLSQREAVDPQITVGTNGMIIHQFLILTGDAS